MEPKPIFSNEIRLGLVLYGGVSLAIYMNGVGREFFDAVRGRGVYKLIKALTDSDVVVDIVSGTSAGGVNGILLSYALANSNDKDVMEFSEYAKLWIESGSVEKLFGRPYQIVDQKRRKQSIFDGVFYRQQLEAALTQNKTSPPKNEWTSNLSELDLFVTATDLDGRVSRIRDKAGSMIDVKDHRVVFHLQHRKDQKTELNVPFVPSELTSRSLAKLATITSCFPVAFPVVNVSLLPKGKDMESLVDARLCAWGRLGNRIQKNQRIDHKLSFVDGGVLSNRPFSTTIDAIYARTAYRRSVRKLFYVDPNPEVFDQLDQPRADYWAANPLQVANSSKIEIPNYQSISSDLKRINEENQHVIRHQQLRKRVQDLSHHDFQRAIDAANHNTLDLESYRQCRLFGYVESSLRSLREHLEPQEGTHDETLQVVTEMMTKQVLEQINIGNEYLPKFDQDIQPWDLDYFIRKHCYQLGMIAQLTMQIQNQEVIWDQSASGASPKAVDPKERQKNRRQFLSLRFLSYRLSWQLELLQILKQARNKLLNGYELDVVLEPDQVDPAAQFKTFYEFLHAFSQVVFAGDESISKLDDLYGYICALPKPSVPAQLDWHLIGSLLPENQGDLIPEKIFELIYRLPLSGCLAFSRPEEMSHFMTEIKLQVDMIRTSQYSPFEGKSMLQLIDEKSRHFLMEVDSSLDRDISQRLRHVFDHFQVIDRLLYPFEALSGISTRNQVDVIRVSPSDARQGYGAGKSLQAKLKGYSFNAFGGFFKDAWRSNDLLWGRLDGMDRLLTGMLTSEALSQFPLFFHRVLRHPDSSSPHEMNQCLEAFIQECLPFATTEELIQIIDYLTANLTGVAQQSHGHNHRKHQQFLAVLIQAGQRGILMENADADGEHRSTLGIDLHLAAQGAASEDQPAIEALRAARRTLAVEKQHADCPDSFFDAFDQAFINYQAMKEHSIRYRSSSGLRLGWLLLHKFNESLWVLRWVLERFLPVNLSGLNRFLCNGLSVLLLAAFLLIYAPIKVIASAKPKDGRGFGR